MSTYYQRIEKAKIDCLVSLISQQINILSLTFLNLSGCNIDDTGTELIVKQLKSNNTLQILRLSFNRVTKEGAKLISRVLEVNTTLAELYLGTQNFYYYY